MAVLTRPLTIVAAAAVLSVQAVVPESDFYPIIEYWKAGDFSANPLCEGNYAPQLPAKVKDYPSRPGTGLKLFARELIRSYDSSVKSTSSKEINYQASQRRRSTDWTSLTASPMAQTALDARQRVTDFRGYRDAFCSNMGSIKADDFCMAMANYTKEMQCLSAYDYEDRDIVLAALAKENSYGYSAVPELCTRSISAGVFAQDLKFEQLTPVPETIPRATQLAEGRSYYMIHKALDYLTRYAEYTYLTALDQLDNGGASASTPIGSQKNIGIHSLFENNDIPEELMPGWKTERVFMINEPRFRGGPSLRTPYAALASSGNNLLLLLRPPLTTYEARLALYNQHSFKYLFNFTGEVHDGASTIFQTLSGLVEFAMTDFYADKDVSASNPTRVTVAGIDLPSSGAAVILASHIQKVLEEKFATPKAALVTAVTFGSPYMSDAVFATYVASQIQLRTIVVQGDSKDLFPCPVTYSCDERVLLPRTGIETGKQYNYIALPGQVRITFDDLATLDSTWGLETSRLQLAAIKDCAYNCYLAGNYCPSEVDKRCSPSQCEAWL
eukprot:Blabericola_migrator_1__6238@NODE_3149_length_2006_cov_626_283651_g1971_i0_p1_GENE_NODE_3149_length_2006_cov_626_283651_g1971_i0NODE_3149_length_2006_cov_626_283651_g1971_i0_p1_ORF_typecomplete_len556_score91_34Lipase_3/PF01764_25/0_00021_NODE_3149_length_2006_cov_626_283651_g1971_i01751842